MGQCIRVQPLGCSRVRYDQCGRVWTQPKADLQAPPTIIVKKPGEV